MAATISKTATGSLQTIIEGTKTRDMKQYSLKGIEFKPASNGVIATLRFKMKPDVEAKLNKASKNGNAVDWDTRNCEEDVVFEGFNPEEVSDFLVKAIGTLKASKATATTGEMEDDGDDE